MSWFRWNPYKENRGKILPNILYGLVKEDGNLAFDLQSDLMDILPKQGTHEVVVYQRTRIENLKLVVEKGDV